jgi:hypothetical protein
MPVLMIVLIVVVALVAVLLVLAATRPAAFHIQRAINIQAPPEKIYPLINDFHNWVGWSPYEKLDPAMAKTYSGAPSGKGAVYEWQGKKAGTGRMEIMETSAPSKVTIKLDFLKPFEGHNTAEFTLDAKGGSTGVTWSMYGPNSFMAKAMSIFVTMDKLLGKEFESGLANLKALAEK